MLLKEIFPKYLLATFLVVLVEVAIGAGIYYAMHWDMQEHQEQMVLLRQVAEVDGSLRGEIPLMSSIVLKKITSMMSEQMQFQELVIQNETIKLQGYAPSALQVVDYVHQLRLHLKSADLVEIKVEKSGDKIIHHFQIVASLGDDQ